MMLRPVQQTTPHLLKRDAVFLSLVSRESAHTNIDREVASNRARQRFRRIRLAHHLTASLHGALALPNHADDGARREKIGEAAKERLRRQISVVLLGKLLRRLNHLQRAQSEAFARAAPQNKRYILKTFCSTLAATRQSNATICCVRSAIITDSSVGNANASSLELV